LEIIDIRNKHLEHETMPHELNPHGRINFLLFNGIFLRTHFDSPTRATNNNTLKDQWDEKRGQAKWTLHAASEACTFQNAHAIYLPQIGLPVTTNCQCKEKLVGHKSTPH
jgi:hypothetical protein